MLIELPEAKARALRASAAFKAAKEEQVRAYTALTSLQSNIKAAQHADHQAAKAARRQARLDAKEAARLARTQIKLPVSPSSVTPRDVKERRMARRFGVSPEAVHDASWDQLRAWQDASGYYGSGSEPDDIE